MLRKTLLTLSASVLLSTAVIAPNAALAQLPVLLPWDVMASMPTAPIPTPKAMAATTSPPTGAMFSGAFWFVSPISRNKQSRTRCRMHRGCIPERSSASSSQVFDHDHASYLAHVQSSPGSEISPRPNPTRNKGRRRC
jgi:hypothetical protein